MAGQPIVLVVDDEASNRKLLQEILAPLGYEVRVASDGEEALRTIERGLPDLILLDVMMPRRDGYSVCKELKANPRTRLVPVIMLTGLDQLPDKLKALSLGVDDFLTKPFNYAELTLRVRSLVSLKRYTDELEHAQVVLEGVAHVVENRDRYTGNHCKRLAEYAERVGRAMGVTEDEVRILRLGGVFHDLGKVAVSDAILNKPGRLTPEEMEVMKTHPGIGAGLCGSMRTMEKVRPLILHHHEKLDGSGYPGGLAAKDIPLLVRIISVVDVYDALATKRSYKESMPQDRCLAILREEVGKGWWDGNVVEALARVLLQPGGG